MTVSLTRRVTAVSVQRGDLLLIFDSDLRQTQKPIVWTFAGSPPDPPALEIRSTGLIRVYDNRTGASSIRVLIPIWFFCLSFLVLFARPVFHSLSAREQRARNHCPTCRYILTANTSGICPECGTPIPRWHRSR